ncbi:CBO0543 family protein [Cytobacillus massiliigabonensis]|uniref:CBO0543 family protein n=1 Tax=Cytobacillus massiliigabonensis TaxID=1871011 RepID=UPI00115ACF7E|nr:CBO0543 family protein [Cytobacillus massiliigabonensis]
MRKEATETLIQTWIEHKIFFSFEFWLMAALLVLPLIILLIKIDKSKIFHICFFGYSVHVLSFYISLVGLNLGLWGYPYQLIPAFPSFSLDSSLVPVSFMLVYQWTINKKKNYYLYAIITSVIFAFIVETLFLKMDLFKIYDGINYFHRFAFYITISVCAKVITIIFLKLQKNKPSAD